MKITAQILLKPTPLQAALLLQTMEAANAACDAISEYAWREKVFSKFKIQSAIYHEIKNALVSRLKSSSGASRKYAI